MKPSKENNKNSSLLRLDLDLHLAIKNELESLKKQKKGKGKISSSDIIRLLLPRLNDEDRAALLSSTFTSEDRHSVAFRNYTKKHKNATEDEFRTLVQFGEISFADYLPAEMKRSFVEQKGNNIAI